MRFLRWCRRTRRIRKKIHQAGIKGFTFLNAVSLLFWIMFVDGITSWEPYMIMSLNFCWLILVAYANQGSVKEERDETYYGKMQDRVG